MTIQELIELQKEFDGKHKGNFKWNVKITDSNIEMLEFLMVSLTGEVGEVANIVKKIVRGDFKLEEKKSDIEEELADVFIYLLKLSYQLNIDLESTYVKKMGKNRERFLNMKNRIQKNQEVNKGKFIAFEGIDGSGKSTQIQLLSNKLRELGIYCYTTMEPTDSPIGSLIHQIMTGRIKTDNRVIAGLFVADRLDHLLNDVDGVLSRILEGTTVITDRYYFSSYAYHSIDMPMDWVIQANAQSKEILQPTITIFIDVDPDTAIERIAKNRYHQELFEKKSRLIKVREKYLEAFEKLKDEENYITINGNKSQAEIAKEIWDEVRKYFI